MITVVMCMCTGTCMQEKDENRKEGGRPATKVGWVENTTTTTKTLLLPIKDAII